MGTTSTAICGTLCSISRHHTLLGDTGAQTGREVVLQTAVMSPAVTAEDLQTLLDTYAECRILLLWGRAPWHREPEIRAVLDANPRLELLVFPTAAPDLNPQEHVWKATRQAVSHNYTYQRLEGLAERFEAYLTDTTCHSSFLEQYGWSLSCPSFTSLLYKLHRR